MKNGAEIILDQKWHELVDLLKKGSKRRDGVVLTRHNCAFLCERLRTAVDIAPVIEATHALISKTLVEWKEKS